MQSTMKQAEQGLNKGLKQVKVDNWGAFFLQRLLQLYFNEELLDMSIKFHSTENILKVHRLVIATCSDYFLQLEREQNAHSNSKNNVILMPSDMSYECVKSIISFMYTGQLEYWTSEQNALYHTAKKMNMTVLTKLLDAQISENAIENASKSNDSFEISEPVRTQLAPLKRTPCWKRKFNERPTPSITNHNLDSCGSYGERKQISDNVGGPSRFDLPELEDVTLGVFSSFDDITYNTKPIARAPGKTTNNNESNALINDDMQSDAYLSYNEESCSKMTYDKDNSEDDWSTPDISTKSKEFEPSSAKKVRFKFDEKENIKKIEKQIAIASGDNAQESVDNHAKIIREVLKKYPHLVKDNKNIRLKIMQKESKSNEYATPGKTKVSYVVLKSDTLMMSNSDNMESKNSNDYGLENHEIGPWKCVKCNLDEKYNSYYMYRRHMQDVHDERFDPRICEHCGYKATKRNILMYHMYTKHNVAPPKNMSFPKCQHCSYVALSESLLIRHQMNHKHSASASNFKSSLGNSNKCRESDKEAGVSDEGNNEHLNDSNDAEVLFQKKKGYCCSYCGKYFMKRSNLKIHIEYSHSNAANYEHYAKIPSDNSSSNDLAKSAAGSSLGEDQQASSEKVYAESQHSNEDAGMMVSEENESQTYKENSYSLDTSKDDEVVVKNSDGNLIVYINSSTYEANKYNNDEVVEEVVEELEAIEEERTDPDKQVVDVEMEDECKNNVHHIESYFEASQGISSTDVEEGSQYVEEETEILEYVEETSTTA